MKVIEEFHTDLYNTQNEAINKLVSYFEGNDEYHFYLRIHPNLGKVKNVQTDEVNQMEYNNLTIIGPNQPIDTYAIIDACDKSIVFGSTSGIEATYWGKASVLLGKSFYYYLEEACYKPETYEDLYKLISTYKFNEASFVASVMLILSMIIYFIIDNISYQGKPVNKT